MVESSERKIVLLISMLGAFLTPFMASSINIALPSVAREFGMSAVMQNWIATSYLLTAAIFVVPLGRLADIYGRKRVYLYGICAFLLSSVLCSFSFSQHMLIFSRVLQGLGSAAIFGTGVAILTSAFPPGERGRVLGANVAVTYFGLSVGPILGGILTQHFGWRSIFAVNIPIGIIVIIMVVLKLKSEWREAAGEKFDYIGSVLYGAALLGIMWGLSLVRTAGGIVMMGAGIAGIIAFLIYESRIVHPIIDTRLLMTNRVFVLSSMAALINYSATYAVTYILSLYLQDVRGMEPKNAGYLLMVQPVIQAVLSPVTGHLSDRIEARKVASAGMAFTAVGLLLLMFLEEGTSLVFIAASLAMLGLGFALFSSPNTNAIMSSVERKYYGIASGFVGTMRLVGQTLSMAVTALIITIYVGNAQITREYHPNFMNISKMAFLVFTVLCTLGIGASLARRSAKE